MRDVQWRAVGPLLRGAAAVIAVSRFEQQMFQKLCGIDASQIKLIQNGGSLPISVDRAEAIPGRIISAAG